MKSTTLKIIFTSVLLSIVFTGKSFVDCEKEEQQKCLKLQEREANDNWMSTGEKPFFFIFKELVLAGAAKS